MHARSIVLFVGLGLATSCLPIGGPAPFDLREAEAAATTGPLHTTGSDSLIYDAENRPVRLVGFNWTGTENGGRIDGAKLADGCGAVWRTPADRIVPTGPAYDNMYQVLRDWGYNVVRIPVSWNDLEPVAPVRDPSSGTLRHSWNQTYIDDLKSMVTAARANGLMVILDMHQDYWSPALHRITNWDGTAGYCEGVGMPRWLDPSIDVKPTTTQNVDFFNAMNWFFRDVHDPAFAVAGVSPWQLLYSAWDQVAYQMSPDAGFAAADAVVGADLLNEPYISYVGGNPPPGRTVLQAAGDRLVAFYDAIAPAVTRWRPSWLLVFQDSTGGYNTANPAARETPTMTRRPTVAGNWVYSIHVYDFAYGTFSDGVPRHDDFGITVAGAALANAQAWRVPLYIGEFTNFSLGVDARQLTDAAMTETAEFLAWAKANRVSWTFWAYANPYMPMTVIDVTTNQAIAVVQRTLAGGLDGTAPPPPVVTSAEDGFSRSVTGGWGVADTGGAWTTTSGSGWFSVAGGRGSIVMAAPSVGPSIHLTGVASTSTDTRIVFTTDKPPTGSGVYVSLIGRRVNAAGDLRVQVRLLATGEVGVSLLRTTASGAQTVLRAETVVPGVTFRAGTDLRIRLQVTGTWPTVVQAKVWSVTEPAQWTVSATDGTAALQVAGAVGVMTYLSGRSTNAPVTARFDDLRVTSVG